MARLYTDEQFPREVSVLLRELGHDVLTVQEAGKANLGIPDYEVLAFAIKDNRAVVTLDRQDFIRLHKITRNHCGVVVCTNNPDRVEMTNIIDQEVSAVESLSNRLIRVVRPDRIAI